MTSTKRSSIPMNSTLVVPSRPLDDMVHLKAEKIVKKTHEKSFEENGLGNEHRAESLLPSNGNHGYDLMTPPNILLNQCLRKIEELTTLEKEENNEAILELWIRCTALARIVHGDVHWELAKTHIQLGRTYLQLKDLPEQALHHATKGRDILLAPGGHVMSHDHPPPEAIYQLSSAYCVIGRVQTIQDRLPEAERMLLKAEKTSERYCQLHGGGGERQGAELDLDIVTAMGRLCLKQKKFKLAKECFKKAVDLTKTASFGNTNCLLIPLLRGQATAEVNSSEQSAALQTLEEALQVARECHGSESEQYANLLVAQGRLVLAGDSVDQGSVEEIFQQAYTIYSSIHSKCHKTAIACKEEMCTMLSSNKDTRERAIPVLKELLAAKKQCFGELSLEVGESYKLLGTVYLTQGKLPQARKCLEKAKDCYVACLGPKHKDTLVVSKSLEVISGSASVMANSNAEKKPIFKTVV